MTTHSIIFNNKDYSESIFSSKVWLISSRPSCHAKNFAKNTLLFQPDIRQFCIKGDKCNVKNEEHFRIYCHDLPPKTKSSEKTASNPLGVPLVNRTWTLENGEFVGDDPENEIPTSKTVIFYCHGHRTRYYKAISALNHMNMIIQSMEKSISVENIVVVGFLWPCHTKKISYMYARDKASTEAASRFTHSIEALKRRNNRVIVVAHSMGARVVLSATASYIGSIACSSEQSNDGDMQKKTDATINRSQEENNVSKGDVDFEDSIVPIMAQSILLLGAAVPCTTFHDATLVTSAASICSTYVPPRVFNIHSRRDEVLGSGFTWAEPIANALTSMTQMFNFSKDDGKVQNQENVMESNLSAMGAIGIWNENGYAPIYPRFDHSSSDIAPPIRVISQWEYWNVDVTEEVPTHSVHAYLASPTFLLLLLEQVIESNSV